MNADLSETNVLITGASGGIGAAAARAFAAEGARVALHYHSNRPGAEALQKELGAQAVLAGAELRDVRQTSQMFKSAVAALGRIDALVVNAGIWVAEPAPLHEMSWAQWRTTLDVNLHGAFTVCRAFLKHLAAVPRASASIVIVASTAALFGEAGHTDYAASKAALAYGLTPSLKNEIVRLCPRGRVNCVCPGWTVTPMTAQQAADPALVARVTATVPLRKLATAEEVADAIVFLSSDRLAGHISGAILPVAGGMEGRLLHSPV